MNSYFRFDGVGSEIHDGDLTITGNLTVQGSTTSVVNQTVNGDVTINGQVAGNVHLTVKGAAAQSANLQEWKDSANAVLLRVTAAGALASGAGAALVLSSTASASAASSAAGIGASLAASNATAGTVNEGAAAGGTVTITAGNAARLTSGNANGGDIVLVPGAGIGTGVSGNVTVASGSLIIPNGTAAAPGIRVTSEATGWYLSSGSTFSLAIAGANKIDFDPDNFNFGGNTMRFAGDVYLQRAAAANWRLGFVAVNPPIAQTLSVQNASGANVAGANWTNDASQGTGSGNGGSWIVRVAPAGAPGSSLNALVPGLTLNSSGGLSVAGGLSMSGVESAANQFKMGAGDLIQWAGRTRVLSPAIGVFVFDDVTDNALARVVFGTNTTSGASLVKSGITLTAALGDGSAGGALTMNRGAIGAVVASASANLKNSNDAEKTTQATVYTKVKEIRVDEPLAGVRVAFDLKTSNILNTATARIYKNGAAVGTERTDVTGVYVNFTEDFTTFVVGDLIQIYAKIDNAAETAFVRNFRFLYDIALNTTTALSATNQDP